MQHDIRGVKAKLRDDRCAATRANETWAMDFVHDQLGPDGSCAFFSRFAPAIVPRFSFKAADVVSVLDVVGADIGLPKTIRVSQGSEFVSRELDLWAYMRGVVLARP